MRYGKAKPAIVKFLQWAHLAIVITSIITISLLHYYTENFLDFLRLPTFLKDIDLFLGSGWPASLHVYQAILLFFIFVSLVDALGLFFYSSRVWRLISDASSFLGFLIILPVCVFFILTLASLDNLSLQSIQTILVYFAISLVIFILDLVTWFVEDRSLLKK